MPSVECVSSGGLRAVDDHPDSPAGHGAGTPGAPANAIDAINEHSQRQTLGREAARGALPTLSAQGAKILLQVVGIVVLARLLAPSDYGLIVMATAIIGVAEVFRDLGLSSAAVQAKTLSRTMGVG